MRRQSDPPNHCSGLEGPLRRRADGAGALASIRRDSNAGMTAQHCVGRLTPSAMRGLRGSESVIDIFAPARSSTASALPVWPQPAGASCSEGGRTCRGANHAMQHSVSRY